MTESELLAIAKVEAMRQWTPPRWVPSREMRRRKEFVTWLQASREEDSWFRWQMYEGYQEQFLDRLEGEEPEDFDKRRNKETRNITAMLVDLKGSLYRAPPSAIHHRPRRNRG